MGSSINLKNTWIAPIDDKGNIKGEPKPLTLVDEIEYNRLKREEILKGCVNVFKGEVILTPNSYARPKIKDVIFNPPATIVFWSDGTKTVVKCQDGDEWDAEKGLAMAVAKKYFGNKGNYNNEFNKWLCSDGLTAEGLKDIFVRMADMLDGLKRLKL